MRIGVIATATLLVSTVAFGMQDAASEPDVVVIGRRMRLVRLDYALNGPHLRRCDVEVSSGDVRVDRTMCAVLRRCVLAGYREPRPAKRCMDASIDLFASGKRRPPEPEWAAAAPPPTPSRSMPKPAPVSAAPTVAGPDIVVEGDRVVPAGGQWRFTKLHSAGIGRVSQVRWARCIPDEEWAVMVRSMLNGEETRSADGRCGPMTVKRKRGRLSGERTCLSSEARMKTLVRGFVSQDRIRVDETTYLVASLSQHVDDVIRVPEDDRVAKVYGERIGACSPSKRAENGPKLKP